MTLIWTSKFQKHSEWQNWGLSKCMGRVNYNRYNYLILVFRLFQLNSHGTALPTLLITFLPLSIVSHSKDESFLFLILVMFFQRDKYRVK